MAETDEKKLEAEGARAPGAELAEAGAEPAETAQPAEPEVDPTGRVVDPGPDRFHWGVGRRKNAVARVRVRPGSGQVLVNDRSLAEYFPADVERQTARMPLVDLQAEANVDVLVMVSGGGFTGQAGAIRMGLARALCGLYPDARAVLRRQGHLTRDARMVERKKYGLAGARRAFQWVKR